MNPNRPNCLDNDYIKGCKVLQDAYSSLFEGFLSIAKTRDKFSDRSCQNSHLELSVPGDKISGTKTKLWSQWAQSLYNIAMQPEKYKDEVLEASDDVVVLNDMFPKVISAAFFQPLFCLDNFRQLEE